MTLIGLIAIVALVLFGPEVFPGNSKLYDAIENGDKKEARRLLAAGADPNSRSAGLTTQRTTRYKYKPLIYALWKGQAEIAQLLVEAGADPNLRMPDGVTVLMEAANTGKIDLVRTLIEKGADVRAVSTIDGETAIQHGSRGFGQPKNLKPEIRAMLERSGANQTN